MAAQNITPAQIPPGDLLTYFGDLASGALRPEDVRIEELTFRATIDATGRIISTDPQNSTVQIVARYNFAIETVRGSIMFPELAGAAPDLIKFNLKEQGRNFDVFKTPVDFGNLVRSGATPMEWRGTYICIPGTQFEVEWFVNTTLWPVLVGGSRQVTIVVGGSYVACAPTQQ